MGRTDVLARGPLELSVLDARVGAARLVALALVAALVSGFAVWLISPRFEIDTPSLVDDWAAISRSTDQLREIVLLENPEEQRFRPGWIVWNALQWHTLDAPAGMVGPQAWNVLRAVVLVAGLTLLMSLLLPRPARARDAVLYAALAGLPAFLVVTVPKFVVDLSRFGPQEPLLVGGMALGGSLLVLAARPLLDTAHPLPRLRTAVLAVAGAGLWALGVYQKETSLAVVPLLAAALVVGRSRLAGWRSLSARRRGALFALGLAVSVPLVHVAIESVRIVARGDLVYDAEVDAGQGIVSGLEELYDWAHEALPWSARAIVVVAFLLVVAAAVVRRRIDVLAVGALASGVLSLVLVAQSGVVATRYYLPAYALFAVALALSLARCPPPVQVAGVLAIALAFLPATEARDDVRSWTDEEERQGAVVVAVADLESRGCVVAVAGLDIEQRQALPVLVDLERARYRELRACETRDTYLLAGRHEEGAALVRTCAPGALERELDGGELGTLYRCARLRATG